MGRPVALGLCAALVLGACSSGSSSSTTPSPSGGSPSSSLTHVPPAPQPSGSEGSEDWLTYFGGPGRSGVDDSSPPLGRPREAWESPTLDGPVYAQPLVDGDRVFVATQADSVYALDAATGEVIWHTNVGEPVPRSLLPCGNIDPTGITGTPAIDPSSGLLYAVAFVLPGRHELVALDTATGHVRFRRSFDAPGADPLVHQQRPALVVANGRVYGAYGGLFGDCGEYHGTVVASALDGRGPLRSYRVPSGRAAGIWAPPGPTVLPSGDLLVVTGNSFSTSAFDFGNAVIRLSPDLEVLDWWAPANWLTLNADDVDLGSLSPTALPAGLTFVAGKEGVGYLLRTDELGHIGSELFSAPVCDGGGAFGGTAVDPPFLYVPCTSGLTALRLEPGPGFRVAWRGLGFDAGPPVLAGGAVWTVDTTSGTLHAFDAATGEERFTADLGQVANFTSPAASAGTLYVPAWDHVVAFTGV